MCSASIHITKTSDLSLHDRLSHLNDRDKDIMIREGMLDGLENLKPSNNKGKTKCHDDGCRMGKSHKRSIIDEAESKPKGPGSHISCDIGGPLPVKTLLGYRYFALFIDLYTRTGFIYFMRTKDEILKVFKRFLVDTKATEKTMNAVHYSMEMLTTDSDVLFMQKKMDELRLHMKFCQFDGPWVEGQAHGDT